MSTRTLLKVLSRLEPSPLRDFVAAKTPPGSGRVPRPLCLPGLSTQGLPRVLAGEADLDWGRGWSEGGCHVLGVHVDLCMWFLGGWMLRAPLLPPGTPWVF